MGSVARLAVVRGPGISKSPLTAEDIAQNLDEILDIQAALLTDFRVTGS